MFVHEYVGNYLLVRHLEEFRPLVSSIPNNIYVEQV